MFAPGTVIGQKYWVERVLGEGGMGVVLAATHLQLGQRVALKFLRPETTRDAELVERFLREARATVRLKSEHVCRVVDVGTEDGAPYIVMEHLEGHDLAAVVKQGGPLRPALAADYVVQACLALAEAHAAGIVHRDLKPSNLFLTRRPEGTALVKVMDFGIAKLHGRMDARLTDSAAIVGSPSYMAPEQLKSSRDVDARADVWSLGVVLHELVTGTRPFEADSIAEICAKVTLDPPAPLPPSIPRAFADVIRRCLDKDASRRFRSVGDLAQALAPFGSPSTRSIAAHAARVADSAPRTDPLARVMGAVTQPRWKSVLAVSTRRRRIMLVSGAALLVALLGITLVVLTGSGSVTATDSGSGSGSATGSGSGSGSASASAAAAVADAAAAADAAVALDAGPPVDAGSGRNRPGRSQPTGSGSAAGPPPVEGDTNGDGIPDQRDLDPPRVLDPEDTNGDGIPDIR